MMVITDTKPVVIIQADFEFESYQKKRKVKKHWGSKKIGSEISQTYFPIRIKHSVLSSILR